MTDATKPWRAAFTGPLTIGDFDVDPSANELRRDGQLARLRPLLMDVLLRLAAAPGQVVSREQLIEEVWPRRMVNDEVLSRAIAELRTALADDAREPRYIETLPKLGYRLIAAVGRSAPPAGNAVAAGGDGMMPDAAAEVPAAVMTVPSVARPGTGRGEDHPRSRRRLALLATAALLGIAAVVASAVLWRSDPDSAAQLTQQLAAARTFAADADLELAPRFSPDGSNVIYAQGTGGESRIVIRDLAGNVVTTIEKPGALLLSPVFGPWSRRIFYWRRGGNGGGNAAGAGGSSGSGDSGSTGAGNNDSDDCAIVERDLATSAERDIVGCTHEPQPRFDVSFDGAYIVAGWRPRPQQPFGIARIRVSDGSATMLSAPQPGEGDDGTPRFSPDGSRVAFARGNASHAKVQVVDVADPSSARAVSPLEGLLYGAAWMSNRGPLLIAADWPGFRALHRLDLATGKAELVGARGARFPDISTSGDIVFEEATYRADLWLTDADAPDRAPQVLWPSSRYSNQPEFSPDGRRVAFTSNRDGAEALYVGTLGGDARRLAAGDAMRYIRPHWTPDGASIHAVRGPVGARQSGPREAVRVDAGSGRIEVLSRLGTEVNDVRALEDGTLLVADSAGNAMRLRIVPGDDRAPASASQRLALPLVSQLQVRGNDLVFTQPDLTTLTRCRLPSLACAPLPVKIADTDLYHWHLGNGVLWYRARTANGPARLMKLTLADGTQQAFDFAPTGNGTALAASADGRSLVVTREAPPAIDLMLSRP